MIVSLILKLCKIIKSDWCFVLICILIPIWGFCMLVVREIRERDNARIIREYEISRMNVDQVMKSVYLDESNKEVVPISEAMVINDRKLKQDMMKDILYDVNSSIYVEEDDVIEKVVPLSEALVMNDAATRRALIMDVLYSNPSDYISQLKEAKRNDDTEVVHYAVTALVELQKGFDLKFQDIFQRRELEPDNDKLDREYENLMERYISSGLLNGDGLRTQLINYRELLYKRIANGNDNWTTRCKLADTNLQLADINALKNDVDVMMHEWPERDSTYIYRIKLAILTNDAKKINSIFDELETADVYMSSELRSLRTFWDRGNNE